MENQIFSNYVNLSFFHILTAWKIEIAYTFCKLSLSSYRHNHFNITTDIVNLKSVFFWLTIYHIIRFITYYPSKCFSSIVLLHFSTSTRLSSPIEANHVNPVKILTSLSPHANLSIWGILCTPMGHLMYLSRAFRVRLWGNLCTYINSAGCLYQ